MHAFVRYAQVRAAQVLVSMVHVSMWCALRACAATTSAAIVIAIAALFPGKAVSSSLDSQGVSDLIATTAQDVGQPFHRVHIEFLNPADYLRPGQTSGDGSFDFPSLFKHIDHRVAVPLGFAESLRIGRYAAFAFFNREMATSLHPLPDGSTLCMIFPMPAPIGLDALAALLSGNKDRQAPGPSGITAIDLYRFLLYHEVAHCTEDPWRRNAEERGAYGVYLAESRADAFAALMHIKRTGSEHLPRFMVSVRRDGMTFRDDFEHQTAEVLEAAIAFAAQSRLTEALDGMTLRDVMQTARTLTREHALPRADFEARAATRP